MPDKSSLGDRMKHQYERRAQTYLPRRTYTIIRLDGKAFHTYTRGCEKPYDLNLARAMGQAAAAVCIEAQGSCFAYVQSDEISVLLTDFATTNTDAWFDGNVQKIVSVSASVATAVFNAERPGKRALFDSRVFTIPDRTEVENYFIWRQQDCVRNSIQGLAQAHYSQAQIHGLNTSQLQEKLWSEKGINWAGEDERFKNGVIVEREKWTEAPANPPEWAERWRATGAPTFTQHRDVFERLIPSYE